MLLAIRVSLLLSATVFLAAQNTASIQGTITDRASNQPIAGAFVAAIRTALPPARGDAVVDKFGAFTLPNLPPGDYRICVQVTDGKYLNPCQWSGPLSAAATFNVRAGQATGGVKISLAAASILRIQINDPQRLLEGHPERELMIGVFTGDGTFAKAPLKSNGPAGRLHEIAIPFGTATKLYISGAKVNLADEAGASVSEAGRTISVTHADNGASQAPIVVTVTGLKP